MKSIALIFALALSFAVLAHEGHDHSSTATHHAPTATGYLVLPIALNNVALEARIVFDLSQPVEVGESASYKICFVNPKTGDMTVPASNLTVKSFITMNMGSTVHGSSPVTITFDPTMPNYVVTDVNFLMQGVWQIHVELVDENGLVVDQGTTEYNAE